MAENPVKGIQNFLGKEMAGLPVWVWGVVIIAGIGAAYFIPKLFGGVTSSSDQTGTGAPGGGAFAGQVPAGCIASGSGGECPPGYTQQQLADGTVLCCPVNPIGGTPPSGGPPPVSPPPPGNPPKRCDQAKFEQCIDDYDKKHPHHKPGAAHAYCYAKYPECRPAGQVVTQSPSTVRWPHA